MKTRHAAALALVGWYLMLPPDRPKLDDSPDWVSQAPLGDWQIVQRFDAQWACNRRQQNMIIDAQHAIKPDAKAHRADAVLSDYAIANNVACVSTDDPRVKSK
jgi:hypothetical protein